MAQITLFAGNFAPQNWAFCNGALQSISDNSALFSLIGTTYGGDGQTTFGLPDLQGRIAVGTGQGPGLPNFVIGQAAGTNSATITSNQMPAHTHAATATVPASSGSATSNSPNGNSPAATATPFYAVSGGSEVMGGASGTVQAAGGSAPIGLGMPSLGLNYVICLFGIYPARN